MNGDRPDIVVMKKGQGILIIKVKDYDLNNYELDARKNFIIKSNNTKTYKSPISQALKYKNNLFETHIENRLENKTYKILYPVRYTFITQLQVIQRNQAKGFLRERENNFQIIYF